MEGRAHGREEASTMYCSDSAFAIYEFNDQKEVKMSDTVIIYIIENISGK